MSKYTETKSTGVLYDEHGNAVPVNYTSGGQPIANPPPVIAVGNTHETSDAVAQGCLAGICAALLCCCLCN